MLAYLLRRLLYVIPTLLGVTIVVFLTVHLAPGDAARARLGSRATAESLARERERLGLNDPAAVQYLRYLGSVLRGDLGISIVRQRPVVQEIGQYFPATLELSLAAMAFAVGLGILIGVLSAVYQHSLLDYVAMSGALVGVSMPIFWLGLILLVVFSHLFPGWPTGQRIDFLTDLKPITGLYLVDTLLKGDFKAFISVAKHLLLPAMALGTIPLAIIARMTRSAMLEVLGQDYVRTARAKGLSAISIYFRHAFRNALIPVLTVVGLQFGSLLGGAIITETIFSWPGVGTWILDAIQNRDTYVIQGGVLLVASVFIAINIAVDLLYAVVDPRIQYQ